MHDRLLSAARNATADEPTVFSHDEAPAVAVETFRREIERLAPWFRQAMPAYYFRSHTAQEVTRHLMVLATGGVTPMADPTARAEDAPLLEARGVVSWSDPDRGVATYIAPGSLPDALGAIMNRLGNRHGGPSETPDSRAERDIHTARLYASRDDAVRLATFLLAPQPPADPESPAFAAARTAMTQHVGAHPETTGVPVAFLDGWEDRFARFLAAACEDYIEKFDPERSLRHFVAALSIADREGSSASCESLADAGESRVMLTMPDPPRTGLLRTALRLLARHGLDVRRGYLDHFDAAGPDFVREEGRRGMVVLSFYVRPSVAQETLLDPESEAWARLQDDLERLKWYAPHGLEALADAHGLRLRQVMTLMAGCEFAHQFLIAENLWAYTADNMVEALLRQPDAVMLLVRFFEARFDPTMDDDAADLLQAELSRALDEALAAMDDPVAEGSLAAIHELFRHSMRTNAFLPGHCCLAFRLDPTCLELVAPTLHAGDSQHERPRPYAIYFVHGPYAQGFHVRHRQTARGGVRVVTTRTQEQFELESNRLYKEAAALAHAQQLKNKDIPEGGAKAVLLLGPEADLDLCVRGFADAILDLVAAPADSGDDLPRYTAPMVKDYLGREELLYLGPDEHIAERHIEWFVRRAGERGYRWPLAFMSSKPRAGVNHKEYGVTSLGVVVYARHLLTAVGVDPAREPFAVKFTGGPRGDVAGNAMRILMRDYPNTARIVAVSDGSGAAFDPEGLDHAALSRLIAEERSIADFPTDVLRGEGAFVESAATPEGQKRRNTLFATARADLFIPAGGRPDTLNAKNWRTFLDDRGSPTARVIVEGANLFLSAEARAKLEQAGALIAPGPSANKTGVICSSYEVLAGLAMTEAEFLEEKPRYVREVLALLERRAEDEARLLLRERAASGDRTPLSALSSALSLEITAAADLLEEALAEDPPNLREGSPWRVLLFDYCPPLLAERRPERLLTGLPPRYLAALLAAAAASRIVYQEGLGWLSRRLAAASLAELVEAYLVQEQTAARLLGKLEDAAADTAAVWPEEERRALRRLLLRGGRGALADDALQR